MKNLRGITHINIRTGSCLDLSGFLRFVNFIAFIIIFIMSFSHVIAQESNSLRSVEKLYDSAKYKEVITILNTYLRQDKITDVETQSLIRLYLGLSYYKTDKEFRASIELEEC